METTFFQILRRQCHFLFQTGSSKRTQTTWTNVCKARTQ